MSAHNVFLELVILIPNTKKQKFLIYFQLLKISSQKEIFSRLWWFNIPFNEIPIERSLTTNRKSPPALSDTTRQCQSDKMCVLMSLVSSCTTNKKQNVFGSISANRKHVFDFWNTFPVTLPLTSSSSNPKN